jgi:branched-chain amino acid transport system permease protein
VADFLTSRAVSDFLVGLVSGATIGLVALSLVLIWRSTHVLNFAQGAMATFAAYCGMSLLSYHVNFWWCLALAVVAGLLVGGVTERVLVRPLYGKPEINPIVVMVGFLFTLESLIGAIWGTGYRGLPLPFSFIDWQIDGKTFALSPNGLFAILAAALVAIAIAALFRFTNLGLQLRASAAAPEVSRLLGVRVSRMLTIGWMLASGVGVIAALLYAMGGGYGASLNPTMMETPFAIAFVAAAVGGLDSPLGALAAGVGFGILQSYVNDYLNSNYSLPIMLGILVAVLMVRPQGLFTRPVVRRV